MVRTWQPFDGPWLGGPAEAGSKSKGGRASIAELLLDRSTLVNFIEEAIPDLEGSAHRHALCAATRSTRTTMKLSWGESRTAPAERSALRYKRGSLPCDGSTVEPL